MLVACSWGLSPSWSSFEQISPTIESWNGIKKVYVTSRQEEAHIKRKREMRGFERKKNRYIYISTKALVAQWEFRWRINWQISSQLPAYPVSLWKTQGRLMRLCHRVSPRRSFPFSTNGKQRLRAIYPRREHCFFAKNEKREREKRRKSLETGWAIVARTGYAFWMRFIISIICYLFKNDNAMGLGRRAQSMADERRHEGQFISFPDDRISRLVHLHVAVPVESFPDIHL